jgi:hypothetical protein
LDNYSTLSVQAKLNQHASAKAQAAIAQLGRALPCSVVSVNGALVTVKFEVQSGIPWTLEQLTLPKAESQWLRVPTQIGDYGITVPADTDLSQISGQDGGVADMSVNYGNLSTLVFVPVASTAFAAPPRANIAWANGPHGARVGDSANAAYLDCNSDTGTVTIHAAGKSWTFGAAGLVMSTGVIAETHLHGGVQGGPSDTGPPIA